VAALLSGSVASADEITYVVESGDALSTLARQFDVTVSQIRRWNDLDGDMIRIGQELEIHPGSAGSSGFSTYIVVPGDSLSAIARRHDVAVSEVVAWNSGLDPDRIRIGQELRIQGYGRVNREVSYEVQAGDALSRIARRYRIDVAEILGWNDGLDPDRIMIGQELTLYISGPEQHSESVGRANRGRLVNGEQLPPHRAYRMRDADRSWGTNETVAFILEAFDAQRRAHPDSPRVMMHDLSDEDGGSMNGHHSHQSGRDADIGLYQEGYRRVCPFETVDADDLDAELQWDLIRYWLRHDQVDYIFLDYRLQRPLYEYARDQGATSRQLNEWFQYPHGRRVARGVIRHEPNHRDHLHIRFSCSSADDSCR
jgi:LysM repeat protein